MATYVIGDLQGCLTPLRRLLDHVDFNPSSDRLWFCGDLVNRGPESLECLRYVKQLGSSAITVLGNHDLHLLAVMHGVRKPGSKDTLDRILRASDRDELEHWLRRQPLLHHDPNLGCVMVHAGIHPHWTLALAKAQATELEALLPSARFEKFLPHMYGDTPAKWNPQRGKKKRRRFAINVFTRMRYCRLDGALDFSFNGPPSRAPAHLVPWYQARHRIDIAETLLYGHWSSHPGMAPPGLVPLDRGCVWGGSLTAYEIERQISHSAPCAVPAHDT